MGLALEQLKTQITALSAAVATPASIAAVKAVVDADKVVDDATVPAIGALLAPLSTSAPQALDAAGGAAPTHAFAIPAGARSFAVGSCNAARTNYLTGFAAPSDLAHTHSAGVVTLNGSGFIPALLDDGATAPTHIYVENTDASAGWAWVEFYG